MAVREIKVGLFVLIGMVVLGVVVFMIGEERQLFAGKVPYKAAFKDVEGLRRGSPVRMGGVDIGTVTSVGYSDKLKDPTIYVHLEVVEEQANRIRQDSVATIEGKGFLGDKMIVVTVGDAAAPRVPPEGMVPTEESRNLTAALKKLGEVTAKVEGIVTNLEKTTETLAQEEFQQDLQRTLNSVANIVEAIDKGDGYAARFLRDPAEADRISRTVANLERASGSFSQTMANVNDIVERVEKGPGFAHEVVYSDGPNRALDQFGGAAEEVQLALKGIREGDGMAHALLYGGKMAGDSGQLVANLNAMSTDLKHIVEGMRAGKGTLGALLVDPSVYEDVKMLLGNVGRNKALRALVRYSIQQDEKAGLSIEAASPEAQSAADVDSP